MIGYLKGQIREMSEDGLVVDVSGVGYELLCSAGTLEQVASQLEAEFFIQAYFREDSIQLFGFATQLEKRMFLSLVKVNGVGPKMAIKILSAARIEDLAGMIEAGDVKALSGLPKVGKKTAEQLVLALRGKLGIDVKASASAAAPKRSSPASLMPRFTGARADVLSALVNLGFRMQEAETVVATMPEDIEVRSGVRQGLQALTGA